MILTKGESEMRWWANWWWGFRFGQSGEGKEGKKKNRNTRTRTREKAQWQGRERGGRMWEGQMVIVISSVIAQTGTEILSIGRPRCVPLHRR